jgi:hypothetical protein
MPMKAAATRIECSAEKRRPGNASGAICRRCVRVGCGRTSRGTQGTLRRCLERTQAVYTKPHEAKTDATLTGPCSVCTGDARLPYRLASSAAALRKIPVAGVPMNRTGQVGVLARFLDNIQGANECTAPAATLCAHQATRVA